MKCPREVKLWINRIRKNHARKNGIFSGFFWDHKEVLLAKNKNKYDRNRKVD